MIRILTYGDVTNDEIFARAVPAVNVEAIVAEIIENVKTNGDKALFEYAEKFDKATLSSLQVTAEEIDGHDDLATAFCVLCNDMFSQRDYTLSIHRQVSPTVKTILSLYAVNHLG